MLQMSDPTIVKNTVYHKRDDITVSKAKDMNFDIGFGMFMKEGLKTTKIPEGFGSIKAY